MVLEQYFKTKWIEQKPTYAFLLGIIYSIVGIISARLIFGSNPGLMSVAFISILLIPSLNNLLQQEENDEIRQKKFSLRQLVKDHTDIFEIYLFLFLGIFVVFLVLPFFLPLGTTLGLFAPQLKLAGITGSAYDASLFISILRNNLLVFIVCAVLSLAYGAGAVLFLTWNASVWGAVIGFQIKESLSLSSEPASAFFGMLLPIMPHLITEAAAYLSAAIAGGIISKAAIREKLFSKKFNHVLTDGLLILFLGFILVFIAALFEVYVFG